jgi:hypothetical protein
MKTETQHTPGPWRFNEYPTHADLTIWGSEGTAVVTELGDYLTTHRQNCANARLIAAAPELVTALESIESKLSELLYQRTLDSTLPEFYTVRDARNAARQAIAKAKGEQ